MRMGGAKHRNDPRQGRVSSSAHVHGGDGQPYCIDANHLRMAAVQLAKSAVALTGHVMVIDSVPLRSSILRSEILGSGIRVGSFKGMNAWAGEVAAEAPD